MDEFAVGLINHDNFKIFRIVETVIISLNQRAWTLDVAINSCIKVPFFRACTAIIVSIMNKFFALNGDELEIGLRARFGREVG